MTWDKNSLNSEVDGYEDGVKVNWSEIARRYKITNRKGDIAKNGGQIPQEWLTRRQKLKADKLRQKIK